MAVVYKEQAAQDGNDPSSGFTDPRSYEVCKTFSDLIRSLPAKCWVAGGAILSVFTDTKINDIDLYFVDESDFNTVRDYMRTDGTIVSESDFSLKIERDGRVFDLIKIFRKNPQQTIKGFDFIICCAAVDQDGILYYMDGFFNDLNNKMLRFNSSIEVMTGQEQMLQRINKYGRKGFELSVEESKKCMKLLEKIKEDERSDKKKTLPQILNGTLNMRFHPGNINWNLYRNKPVNSALAISNQISKI